MGHRNVIFIETPLQPLPPPSGVSHPQLLPSSNATDVHNYTTDSDVSWELRDFTWVFDPLTIVPAYHMTAGGFSTNLPVAELLDRISDITRRDILAGGATGRSA